MDCAEKQPHADQHKSMTPIYLQQRPILSGFALFASLFGVGLAVEPPTLLQDERPILVVTTDIGGDPDDQQSLRRLMLYANEFDLRGVVASASGTPQEIEDARPRPDLIHEIIDDYARVLPQLRQHAKGYPSAESLHKLVVSGDPIRSVGSIRVGSATAASSLITQVVDQADRPVYLAIWGGARDLAQALCDVRASRSGMELDRFIGKLRVYAVGDQDGHNAMLDGRRVDGSGTGGWIKENFPALRYVETSPPQRSRYAALFRGMYQNDSKGGKYAVTPLVRPGVERLNNEEWVNENVRTGHGALGAGYPIVGQNPTSERNARGVKEGDTPSWFFVLPNGLNDPEHPIWGGWGGRFAPDKNNHFIDTEDAHWHKDANEATRIKWTVARWREAQQHDFAARMDWCIAGREAANHAPSLAINGDATRRMVRLTANPGEVLSLDVTPSDEDGDAVTLRSWVYAEVTGVAATDLKLPSEGSGPFGIMVTPEAAGKQYHVIVEATDAGSPALTAYRRIVIDVKERETLSPAWARTPATSWADLPAILARIEVPVFPDRDFDIREHGAVAADGALVVGAAIQRTIDACHAAGGGRVIVPAGEWPTAALRLRSNVNLHVSRGAVLRFTPDLAGYPLVHTSFEGVELMNFSPLVYAFEAENIALTGEGTMDGSASWDTWWDWLNRPQGKPFKQTTDREELLALNESGAPVASRVFGPGRHLRPSFVEPYRCRNVLIEGVTIVRAPFWVLHPVQSENVTIRQVTVSSTGPNNDGCDPESCRDVLIEDCTFDTGDDCIAIKSGRNEDGRRIARPSENIVVRNCRFRNGHGGVVVGSEISGGCQNVFVENCELDSPKLDLALRFKNNARRGGVVQNVFVRDLEVKQVRQAVLAVQFDYEEGAKGPYRPVLRNVRIENLSCRDTPSVLLVVGFDGAVIEDIVIARSTFQAVRLPDVVQEAGLTFENVTITPAPGARAKLPWEK